MSTTLLAIMAFAALTVLALAYGLWLVVNPERSARDRLSELTTTQGPSGPNLITTPVDPRLKAVTKFARPGDVDEADALKTRLIQAGYRGQQAVEMYSLIRMGLTITLPMLWAFIPSSAGTATTLFIVLLLATVGYYLPAILVTNTRQKRQEAITRTFPDALDLMVASVEAGLGVDAAFQRVATEMVTAAPYLCAEFTLVNNEVAAGIPRVDALKRLYKRTGVDDINALVNVLAQSERFGTPVARSLRLHARMVRTKRMQRAETAAAEISPKLTVAMIVFILPCLILILLGPAIVNMRDNLIPAMQAASQL